MKLLLILLGLKAKNNTKNKDAHFNLILVLRYIA